MELLLPSRVQKQSQIHVQLSEQSQVQYPRRDFGPTCMVSGKNHKQEQEEQLSQIDGSENGAASVLSTATPPLPSTTASRPTAVTAQFPAFRPNSGFGFGFLHVAFPLLYCTTVPVLPILLLTFPPDGRSNSHSILRHLFYSASSFQISSIASFKLELMLGIPNSSSQLFPCFPFSSFPESVNQRSFPLSSLMSVSKPHPKLAECFIILVYQPIRAEANISRSETFFPTLSFPSLAIIFPSSYIRPYAPNPLTLPSSRQHRWLHFHNRALPTPTSWMASSCVSWSLHTIKP